MSPGGPPGAPFYVRYRYFLAFCAAMAIMLGGGIWIGTQIDDAKTTAQRNNDAIRIGCVLLSNTITSAQKPEAQKGTQILVRAILDTMTIDEQNAYFEAQAASPPLVAPDCDKVAQDPNGIRLEPTVQPSVIHRESPPPPKPTGTPTPAP